MRVEWGRPGKGARADAMRIGAVVEM
jgi:hypothetical protein